MTDDITNPSWLYDILVNMGGGAEIITEIFVTFLSSYLYLLYEFYIYMGHAVA
jgi:hypothetical protein